MIKDDVDKLKEEIDSMDEKQEAAITEIRDTKIFLSSNMVKEVEEKIDGELKKRLDDLEEDVDKLQDKVEKHDKDIQDIDENLKGLEEDFKKADAALGERIDEAREGLSKGLKNFRLDFDDCKDNYWDLIMRIYGALRGYTVVLKSNGPAGFKQPSCMGVYRMIDQYNDKPAYKQDGGEHYMFFNAKLSCWMVGSRVGQNYGWMRNESKNQNDKLIPDMTTGWHYQPLAQEGNIEAKWMDDDQTLRVEALRDIDSINDVISRIKHSKEID